MGRFPRLRGRRSGQRQSGQKQSGQRQGGQRQGAQSIRRALSVLRILAAGRESGALLADVVQATGLTRPTVHRILHVLIEEGIVEQHPRSKRYAIGGQVSELALARQSRSPLLVAAEPYLTKVSAALGDTLFLTVRTGLDTLCLARRIGTFPIQVLSIEVGVRRPLGVSAAGVAMLASLDVDESKRIISANQPRFESYKTSGREVSRQVAIARRTGYYIRERGIVPGTKSLAAWIQAPGVTAALTVSMIGARLDPDREQEVAAILLENAGRIQQAITSSGKNR
ncbi:MAG TPA: IclR family transcriptional regulator [Bradyrhizobium sp.]|nr:IclR family transcriptional regulator [Bradyrhizobium sp.]